TLGRWRSTNRRHLNGVAVGGGVPSTGHTYAFITCSPPSAARRNGRFYTQSASGKSNSSKKRLWGVIQHTRCAGSKSGPRRSQSRFKPCRNPAKRGEPWPCEACCTDSAACCAPRRRRAAECGRQFPPSDGDCHTPLPCEVRKRNDTTPRA